MNKGYIKFANANTVEVLLMEDLDRAIQSKSKHVRTYEGKDEYGDSIRLLVEFPGLTVDHLREMTDPKGPAAQHIAGTRIPYTSIVDPHTGKKLEGWVGKYSAAKLQKAVQIHRKALTEKHGKGISRKNWRQIQAGWNRIGDKLDGDRPDEAATEYLKIVALAKGGGALLKEEVETIREVVVGDLKDRLDPKEGKSAEARALDPGLLRVLLAAADRLKEAELSKRIRSLLRSAK